MKRFKSRIANVMGVILLAGMVAAVGAKAPAGQQDAQRAAPDGDRAEPEEGEGGAETGRPSGGDSAEQVLNQLLQRRAENPLIEPAPPDGPSVPSDAMPDPLAGSAPGAAMAPPRPEGQFIITRRGRMVRAPAPAPGNTPAPGSNPAGTSGGTSGGAPPSALPGRGWVFVFESDDGDMRDPPMFMMPCRLLEDMERVVHERGDSVIFLISGRVYTYHGANYLLPTLMEPSPRRGNIGP